MAKWPGKCMSSSKVLRAHRRTLASEINVARRERQHGATGI